MGWPPVPNFLFLGFSSYMYRDVLEPVVATLRKHSKNHTVLLHDRYGAPANTPGGEGVEFQSIWNHWTSAVDNQKKMMCQKLRLAVSEIEDGGALPTIVRDQDTPVWPRMRASFEWLFRAYLPGLVAQAAIAQHILTRHRPSLLISPDVADARTRLYCLLGRQLGIRALEVQFGMCGRDGVEWQFFVADRLAVWGSAGREWMLTHGVPAERIVVTGSPRHDGLVRMCPQDCSRTWLSLNVPSNSTVVVFASTYSIPEDNRCWDPDTLALTKRAIFEAVARIPGIHMVVKPHPLENVRQTRQLATGCHNVQVCDPGIDIRDLFGACDAVITLGSTATLDALICGKPVIFPALYGSVYEDDQFLNSGAVVVSRTPEDLVGCLRKIAGGCSAEILAHLESARQQFVRNWAFQTDGLASARVAELALELANRDTTSPSTPSDRV
jgi:hypothetical protein